MKNPTQIKTIIVDDEMDSIEVVEDIINESCPEIQIVGTAQSIKGGIKLLLDEKPDLVLLDIHMPGGSGFDLLKEAGSQDFHTIFISAHENFALKAIKFHAMGYLLKPIGTTEFCEAVQEVKNAMLNEVLYNYNALLSNIGNCDLRRIAIPTGGGHLYYDSDNIIRVEASKNYSKVFVADSNKPILVSKNLKLFENLLSKYGFLRIHNAHLVNPKHIREYIRQDGGSLTLSDGTNIFIGQSYRPQTLQYLCDTSEKL